MRLDLQQASADFRVGEGKVYVDELLLRSPNLKLIARGEVRLDSTLKLGARLVINERISRQLPAFVETNFQAGDEPGTRYIDFAVTGTLAKPKTDLLDRILGKKIQKEVGSIFQNIFGGKRKPEKKEKEKKPKSSPAPSASPTSSPATAE